MIWIDYAEADEAFVHNLLAPALSLAGIRDLHLGRESFRPGAPMVDEIERLIHRSDHVIAVLSPSYMADKWSDFSRSLIRFSDPTAARRKLIPVIITSMEVPDRLRYLTSIDMTGDDRMHQMERLVSSIDSNAVDIADSMPDWDGDNEPMTDGRTDRLESLVIGMVDRLARVENKTDALSDDLRDLRDDDIRRLTEQMERANRRMDWLAAALLVIAVLLLLAVMVPLL